MSLIRYREDYRQNGRNLKGYWGTIPISILEQDGELGPFNLG